MGSASKRLQTHSHLHVLISIVSPGIQAQLPPLEKKKHFLGGSSRENNRGTRSALICGTVFPRFIPLVTLCYQGKLRFGNAKPSSDDPVEVVLDDLTYDVLRFHTSVHNDSVWTWRVCVRTTIVVLYPIPIIPPRDSLPLLSSCPPFSVLVLSSTPLLRVRGQVWFTLQY
jgi:hypothetical protein